MATLGESITRTLLPHALQMDRNGGVIVKMKANVHNSERLSFTVLRSQMETALDSLEVVDSRGTAPQLTFSSPTHFNVKDIQSAHVWDTMLQEARGARVQIESEHGCVDGTLMGMQKDFAARAEEPCSTSVVLLSDGQISTHRIDDIRSLCFLDDDITERLKRESFLKKCAVETSQHYRIIIAVFGEGEGVLDVSYQQHSPYYPAFETLYVVNGIADLNGPNRVERFFTIRNPMHYDLEEVDIQLQAQTTGRGHYPRAYGEDESQSSISDDNLERSIHSDDEYIRASSISTTSLTAGFGLETKIYNIDQKLSLKEGDSVRIFHSETIVNYKVLVSNLVSATPNVNEAHFIENIGGEFLGAGKWILDEPITKGSNFTRTCDIAGHAKYVDEYFFFGTTRCKGVVQKVPDIRRAVCSEIIGNKLRVSYEWCLTTVYRFENGSNLEFDMMLRHRGGVSTRRASRIRATMQCAAEEAHGDETVAEVKLDYYGFRVGVRCFSLTLAPGKETVVTVREESTAECLLQREYSIPGDCTMKNLQFLRSRDAVNESTMKLLEEAMFLVRDFARMKRDRRSHVRKQRLVWEELQEVKEEEEEGNVEDLLGKYLKSVDRAKTMSEGITKEVDRLESNMAETKLKIRKLLSTLNAVGISK
eukprot:TRINITY_DN734_c0_g1_i1.p1 TRINITY_DN734_c0_g1~~TRINITY_DN734_c0_g1_i1.p1  ORF type:complete len:698 (-),score=69.60 TRINITY_DN734_c0_g1_i1:271-2214(-)